MNDLFSQYDRQQQALHEEHEPAQAVPDAAIETPPTPPPVEPTPAPSMDLNSMLNSQDAFLRAEAEADTPEPQAHTEVEMPPVSSASTPAPSATASAAPAPTSDPLGNLFGDPEPSTLPPVSDPTSPTGANVSPDDSTSIPSGTNIPHWHEVAATMREGGMLRHESLPFNGQLQDMRTMKVAGLLNIGTAKEPNIVKDGILAFSPGGKNVMHMTGDEYLQKLKDKAALDEDSPKQTYGSGSALAGLLSKAFSSKEKAPKTSIKASIADQFGPASERLKRFRRGQVSKHMNGTSDAITKLETHLTTVAQHSAIAPLIAARDAISEQADSVERTDALRENGRQITQALNDNPGLVRELEQAESAAKAAAHHQSQYFRAADKAGITNPMEDMGYNSDTLKRIQKLNDDLGNSNKTGDFLRDMQEQISQMAEAIRERVQKIIAAMTPGSN